MVEDDFIPGGQVLGEPTTDGVDDRAFALELPATSVLYTQH
ncbi:hypothetical protein [Streptomyces klenkii]